MSFQYSDEINPLWNLSNPLTIIQAAALIAGFDPNHIEFRDRDNIWFKNVETGMTDSGSIGWVMTSFKALENAIRDKKLKAKLRYEAEPRYYAGIDNLEDKYFCGETVKEIKDKDGISYIISSIPDFTITTIDKADLLEWLKANGIQTGFFFNDENQEPDYLNRNYPNFSYKLEAAVKVWEAVNKDPMYKNNNKSTKKNIILWLEAHAAEYNLLKDDGELNTEAIENQIAKIVNWNKGGPTKTPTS